MTENGIGNVLRKSSGQRITHRDNRWWKSADKD
jgi:hypothetical protein